MPLLLSSLVIASRLSKPNAWHMNSTQSATGSLWSSKTVPVAGVKVLPQDAHLQRRAPSASWPHRWMWPLPHLGQRSLSYPFMKSASPVSIRERWRKSYTLLWLSLTASCAGVRSASGTPSQGVAEADGACHLVPLMVGSPCCRGRGRRRGLPIARSPPPTAAFWRMAMSCGDYRAAELVLAEDQLSARADF